MKNLLASSLMAICLLGMSAQASADTKIGVVDMLKLMAKAPQAEAARKEIQREFGAKQRTIEAKDQQFRDKQERFKRDAPVMSASARSKAERDLLQEQKDLRREVEDLQEGMNLKQRELFASLQRGIGESLRDLAKKEGYDLILGDGILWADEKVDITDKLISVLEAEFKRGKR